MRGGFLWVVAGSIIASCASKQTETAQEKVVGDRSPASYVARPMPNNLYANQPRPVLNTTNAYALRTNGQPFVPAAPQPTPTPGSDPHATPTPAPVTPPPAPVEEVACLSQPLPGTGFTVMNILAGLKLVPGRDVITVDRRSGRASVFYIDWNEDPNILRPIFQTEVQAGSDFHKMAKNSEAFRRAVSFVNGTGRTPAGYKTSDYVQDARTAWLMAILIAFKGDAICVDHVLKDSQSIVPAVSADLQQLPFVQASKLLAEEDGPKKLAESWAAREEQRVARGELRQDIEYQKEEAEFKHQADILDLTSQLDEAEQSLRLELMEVPNCGPKVSRTRTNSSLESFRKAAGLPDRTNRARAPSNARVLLASCRMEIYTQLAKFRENEIKQRARLAKLQQRRKADPDNPGEPTPQEEEVQEKLAKIKSDTAKYQGYLERLTMDVDSSLGTQLDEIQRLQGEMRKKKREDIYGDLLNQQKEIEAADRKEAGGWLVEGVYGGFRSN